MASPPAKRQRRSTVVLSDDEESDREAQLPLAASTKSSTRSGRGQKESAATGVPNVRTKAASRKGPTKSSPKSSPEKSKQKSNVKKEPEKSKSLHAFFGKATEEQRWSRKADTPDKGVIDGEIGDDIIDDDLLDEALLELVDSTSHMQDDSSQRDNTMPGGVNGYRGTQKQAPNYSRRFVKPAIPVKRSLGISVGAPTSPLEEDLRPWSDRYAPCSLEELAVNKRKVGDVQKWLNDVLDGQDRRRMLVLKGPSGSGKSTTLSLLAKAMDLELVTWSNPTATDAGSTSTIALQFGEFLNRSGRFGSLMFGGSQNMTGTQAPDEAHRILVVEEFPASMTRLDSFRSVVLQYLSAAGSATPSVFGKKQTDLENNPPLVMIITETLLTSTTASTDSFTAHRLLGPEISNHPMVTIMDFNPVAVTFVTKALDIVIRKEARNSRRRRMPGPAVLQRLAEIGDVRSAVNTLEFLCVRGDDTGDWSGTVAAKVKRGGADSVPLTAMEKETLELVSQRESTLDMFHATGKVVYNKREDPRMADTRAEPPPKPPDHLVNLYKPKVSLVDIEALLNETGTDIQTFLSSLHENYVLSCNGNSFLEAFEGCADFLSDSDLLNPDTRRLTRYSRSIATSQNYQAGGTDMLRQDEISFQVATRGLLFSLPFPVHRAAHVGGRKGDSFKMFYPASLRLWKPTEEVESLISLFSPQSLSNLAPNTATASVSNSVTSWGARASGSFFESRGGADDSDDPLTSTGRARTYISRDELSLEVLPYLTKITAARDQDAAVLNKITQFHGMQVSESAAEQEPFEETETPAQSSSIAAALSRFGQSQNQMPASPSPHSPSRRLGGASTTKNAKGVAALGHGHGMTQQQEAMEKLYISDDDIQDD